VEGAVSIAMMKTIEDGVGADDLAATVYPDALATHPADHLAFEIGRHVQYAYQPIVDIRTGRCFGFEALLRGHVGLGFASIAALFDHVHHVGILHRVEMMLQEKAVVTAASLLKSTRSRLFFNMDNRVLQLPEFSPGRTTQLLADQGLDPATLCFEISERHAVSNVVRVSEVLRSYRDQSYLLALDDFGTGFSGLQLLYEHHPDIVKIDRFFISGICKDERKRLFVSTIVNLAHILGITVVAEGVETELEFRACKQIGCDLIQGYFIAYPTTNLEELCEIYTIVPEVNRRDRRERQSDQHLMREELIRLPALSLTDSMTRVFEVFRANVNCRFFPVLDHRGYPVGVVRESAIKPYIYSPFGKDLLRNKVSGRTLRHFISPATACDINTDAGMVLAMYAHAVEPLPILVTEDFRYIGVLSPESLLKVINEKNLTQARDQNPLTRMPGNNPVSDYLATVFDNEADDYILAYFDLDNFKPFNDTLGFRQGDRAILMFSDVMRSVLTLPSTFLGHIGGDDFFAGFRGGDAALIERQVAAVLDTFRTNAESFYDPEVRELGYIEAKDRQGRYARFPLLSCSAAVVRVPAGPRPATVDHLVALIADLKKVAKRSDLHLVGCDLGASPPV
jgi:EAL domain-containing protein (putative c-di-GMP-specific phosphodiesterase class I)/GGDEF domain-containing protein